MRNEGWAVTAEAACALFMAKADDKLSRKLMDPILASYIQEWRKVATSMDASAPAGIAGSNVRGLVRLDDVSDPYATPVVSVDDLKYFQTLVYGAFPKKEEIMANKVKKLERLRAKYASAAEKAQATALNNPGELSPHPSEPRQPSEQSPQQQQQPDGKFNPADIASPAWEKLQSLATNSVISEPSPDGSDHHYSYYMTQPALEEDELGEADTAVAQKVLERLIRERMESLDENDTGTESNEESDEYASSKYGHVRSSTNPSKTSSNPSEAPDIDDPEVADLIDWTNQLPE